MIEYISFCPQCTRPLTTDFFNSRFGDAERKVCYKSGNHKLVVIYYNNGYKYLSLTNKKETFIWSGSVPLMEYVDSNGKVFVLNEYFDPDLSNLTKSCDKIKKYLLFV